MISDYTRLSFDECNQLDILTYKQLLVDAFIDLMNQTEEGRDYLERCWMLKQTEPDRTGLRELHDRLNGVK